MAKKKSKANGLSTQGIIERFVIRARRVEAHSLVKSGDIERYADPKMTVSVSEAGDVNIQHHACVDEEAVESLAGRLRPFIVKSEPSTCRKFSMPSARRRPSSLLRKTRRRLSTLLGTGSDAVTRTGTASATASS